MTPTGREPEGGGLAPTVRLGPYEIVSLIGAGGMGEVYRATDTRLGRDVAIKLLPAEFASDPDRLRRFEQESHAVAALSHPNILAIHDVGTHEGAPYFVTELLEGETLRARLQGGALRAEKVMELAVQIAQGLAAAHDKGIVHRDLKPGNVFITKDGHAKILDFGLAKAVAPSTREERTKATTVEALTDAGRVMGTAAYMSPEQVKGLPVDQRSDIFSLGVVLYEMVTGKQAFARDSTTETMAAILTEDPPEPSSVSSVVPPALSRAIAHCLEKRPEERFQTARDLTFELKAILADTTGSKTAPVRATGRRFVAFAAASMIVAAVVVAGIWLLRQPKGALEATNFQLLSTFPGSHRWPTFSPDGSMVAFVSDADGSPQIWVKNLAGGDPIRITSGKLNPSHPSWSPRNDKIVFQGGDSLESQSIWSVPPLGGPARRITEFGLAPSLSANGLKIVFQRNVMGVFVCNVDGTGEQKVESVPDDMLCALDDGPVFSPDGKLLAIYPALTGTGDLWVVPIAGGKPHRLTFDDCNGGHPVWTPDGSSIVFSSARKGSRNIWRIPAAGGTPEPITTGAGEDVEPAISREGTKLIHANVRNTYALMVLDAATGESRQILEQRTPIFWPSVAPTGDWLAFASGGFTGGHVFVVASDGTKLQQIVSETGTTEQLPDWSADGQSLYFLQQGKAELPSLRKVALGGGPSVEVWAFKEHGSYGIPDIAPDGRRVTLNCAENDKNPGAFVRDLPTASMTKLHVALNQPRWSHDGRSLVGEVLGEQRIYVCPPTGEPCTRLGTVEGVLPFWSHDDSNIYFSVPSHSENSIGLSVVNRDGLGERRIAEMSGVFLPLGFPHGTSSNGMMPWVQFRPGRRELWLADLRR